MSRGPSWWNLVSGSVTQFLRRIMSSMPTASESSRGLGPAGLRSDGSLRRARGAPPGGLFCLGRRRRPPGPPCPAAPASRADGSPGISVSDARLLGLPSARRPPTDDARRPRAACSSSSPSLLTLVLLLPRLEPPPTGTAFLRLGRGTTDGGNASRPSAERAWFRRTWVSLWRERTRDGRLARLDCRLRAPGARVRDAVRALLVLRALGAITSERRLLAAGKFRDGSGGAAMPPTVRSRSPLKKSGHAEIVFFPGPRRAFCFGFGGGAAARLFFAGFRFLSALFPNR